MKKANPEYCVCTVALASGEHIVHRVDGNCSLLPPGAHRDYLGRLPRAEHALHRARLKYQSVDGCPECIPEENDSTESDSINAAVAAMVTVSNM